FCVHCVLIFFFIVILRRAQSSTFFPYTTLFRSLKAQIPLPVRLFGLRLDKIEKAIELNEEEIISSEISQLRQQIELLPQNSIVIDRKSTRLNSSHVKISYAVFCLKKKKIKN